MPESFNVLIKELQSLCLDVELINKKELKEEISPEEAKSRNVNGGNN